MSALPVWLLVVLGVIAGVPIYAMIAGYVRRYLMERRECDKGCRCTDEAVYFWPLTLVIWATTLVLDSLVFRPARAAYRAALGGERE